jgi:hypothetical protein
MAKRIALTDGSGRWFSKDSAEYWKEDTIHDGRNWISKATGSQWEHEGLYRTKGGRFILNHWSNWQGSSETYEEISNEDAAIWFSKNDLDPHEACEKEFKELEIQ